VPYLFHLGAGQLRLILDREPITPELEKQLTDAERRGLAILRQASEFGETVGLARSTSHRHLLDRQGRGLLTVVTAAPRDRLEAVTWWFPIVGRVPYRGYFDPETARSFSLSLEAKGLDTYVRRASLYSTLGWFDDPVPRSLLRAEPYDIADTALHERVHETIFLPGDGPYNEAIAVFVAHETVLRLYETEPELRRAAARSFDDDRQFARLLDRLARELEALYALGLGPDAILEGRRKIFERFRTAEFEAVSWQTERYAVFPSAPLSNAYVVARRTYLADLPCFAAELLTLEGNLGAFVRSHTEQPGRRAAPDGSCRFGREATLR
jgi:predicted aminopeptidase